MYCKRNKLHKLSLSKGGGGWRKVLKIPLSWARQKYGRPLFLGLSADLADSTNLSGLAKDFGEWKGWGKYERSQNPEGVLLPQEITEFTNSGMAVGIAAVNFSERPFAEWDGLGAACSTYGSFSYLFSLPRGLGRDEEATDETVSGTR